MKNECIFYQMINFNKGEFCSLILFYKKNVVVCFSCFAKKIILDWIVFVLENTVLV